MSTLPLDDGDDYAPAIILDKPGDRWDATVTEYKPWENKYGMYVIVIGKNTTTGELESYHIQKTVAKSKFAEKRPVIGETLHLVYKGKKKPKGGGDEYHDFALEVDGRAPWTPDWDAVAPGVESKDDAKPSGATAQAEPSADDIPF